MRTHHHGLKRARRRITAILVLEFLTVLSIAAVCAIPARADMMLIAYMNEGAAVHNGTHICMPEAYVRINITRTGSDMATSMNAQFHLSTNTTRNATLGFVPPWISGGYSFDLTIAVNESEMEYAMLGWEDLGVERGFATELIDALGPWVEDADYAVFNMELLANSTTIISAISNTSQELSVNGVAYHYTIASARTFEGNTHEIVHMQLIEETSFLSVQFSPDSHLTLLEEGIQTDAIWDFNVSEFGFDTVCMSAMVSYYHGSGPPDYLPLVIISAGLITIVVIAAILYRRR